MTLMIRTEVLAENLRECFAVFSFSKDTFSDYNNNIRLWWAFSSNGFQVGGLPTSYLGSI